MSPRPICPVQCARGQTTLHFQGSTANAHREEEEESVVALPEKFVRAFKVGGVTRAISPPRCIVAVVA